ncbi:unnamed protein product [Protopolystoma xenopodis]|nr:unnamed protein product [Protopolystoma xenopodis]
MCGHGSRAKDMRPVTLNSDVPDIAEGDPDPRTDRAQSTLGVARCDRDLPEPGRTAMGLPIDWAKWDRSASAVIPG